MKTALMIGFASLLSASVVQAAEVQATIYSTDTHQKPLGAVTFVDTPYGVLIKPHLIALSAEGHGMHIHQHGDCADHGMAAGGHYDPQQTGKHLGPYGKGHLGDLPLLYVDAAGRANTEILAPRLKTSDITNMALMIHAGGDNYADIPPLGGGGARVACGVIK